MDLASFKARYPMFEDDIAIQMALDDVKLLMSVFTVSELQRDLAVSLLTAHVLSVPAGVTERAVIAVKSGEEEVKFSDRAGALGWLDTSSYGKQFMLLIGGGAKRRYGVIRDTHPQALHYDSRHVYDGDIQGAIHDKRYLK